MSFSKSTIGSLKLVRRKAPPPADVDCIQKQWVPGKLIYSTKTAEGFRATHYANGKTAIIWVVRYPLAPISREAAQFIQHIKRLHSLDCKLSPIISYGIDRNGSAFVVVKEQSARSVTAVQLRPEELLSAAKQIISIMATLHEAGIALGNISEHTFTVDTHGCVFLSAPISSFDSLERVNTANIGPELRAYLPPEQLQTGNKSLSADVYSIGALLYQILTQRHYPIMEGIEQHKSFVSTHFEAILHGVAESAPWAKELAGCALSFEPKDRYPSAIEMRAKLVNDSEVLDKNAAKYNNRLLALFNSQGLDPADLLQTPGVIIGLCCVCLLIFLGRAEIYWSAPDSVVPDQGKSVASILSNSSVELAQLKDTQPDTFKSRWANAKSIESSQDLTSKINFGRHSSLSGESPSNAAIARQAPVDKQAKPPPPTAAAAAAKTSSSTVSTNTTELTMTPVEFPISPILQSTEPSILSQVLFPELILAYHQQELICRLDY